MDRVIKPYDSWNMKGSFGYALMALLSVVLVASCGTGTKYSDLVGTKHLQPKKGKGLAIVYFPRSLNGVAASYHVKVNDGPVSEAIHRGEFRTVDLDPGYNTIATSPGKAFKTFLGVSDAAASASSVPGFSLMRKSVTSEKQQAALSVSEGQIFYLELGIGLWREYIKRMPKEKALPRLRSCGWQNPG